MKKDWNGIFRAKLGTITQVLVKYGGYRVVREGHGGGQNSLWCPHHNDSEGNRRGENCHANDSNNTWFCYSCANDGSQAIHGGSYVQVIMQAHNMDNKEAFRFLVHECGEDLREDIKRTTVDVRKEFARVCAKRFIEKMNRDPRYNAAAKYCAGRGFVMRTIKKFLVGFSTGDEIEILHQQGITNEELLEAGIFAISSRTGKMYNAFRGRVTMMTGDNLYGRDINPDTRLRHRYTTSGNSVFNLNAAKAVRRDAVLVVEAAFDAMTLDQYIRRLGMNWSVIATCGTHGIKDEDLMKVMKDLDPLEVIFVPDCDPWQKGGKKHAPGQYSVLKKAKVFTKNGFNVRVLCLPENSDPNDLSKNGIGAGKFKKMVDGALPVVNYEIYAESHSYDLTQVGARESFLQKCKEILASNNVGLTSDIVAQVAELVGKTAEEVSSFLSGSFMKSAVMQYFGICHRHGMTDEEIVKHISELFAKENAKKEE